MVTTFDGMQYRARNLRDKLLALAIRDVDIFGAMNDQGRYDDCLAW